MMKRKLIAIVAIALIIVGITALSKKMQRKPHVPTQAEIRALSGVPVSTSIVTLNSIAETLELTGQVAALDSVNLSAKIPGRVTVVTAREGDTVGAGRALIRLDPTEAASMVRAADAAVLAAKARLSQAITTAKSQEKQSRASIAQARAALNIAEANLAVVEKGARMQERVVAQNAVNTAKANLDNAQANYNRYKMLYDQGAVSAQQLDTYKTQYDIAKAQYDSAVQQLSLIQEGARPEDIQAAQGQVSQAREALRMARANASQVDVRWEDVKGARAALSQANAALVAAGEQLGYTIISTSISGVVAERSVEPGQIANPGANLMTVVDLGTVYFEANLSERDFEKVRLGQPVDVTVDALPGRHFDGKIAKILPVASSESRDFIVKIYVPNPGGRLRPGMFARAHVQVGVKSDALLVPKDAIEERHGDTVVFTLQSKKTKEGKIVNEVKMHLVSIGISNTRVAEILPGTDLAPGQEVVTAGNEGLEDGSKVYVTIREYVQRR